jgi:hypothetical protein
VTNRDCAVLAFKLSGLWWIVTALVAAASLPAFWDPSFQGVARFSVFATLLPAVVSFGVGYAAWFAAPWLSMQVFSEGSASAPAPELRAEPLFAVALSVLGVAFIAEALPVAVNGIALYYQSRAAGGFLGPTEAEQRMIWTTAAKANVAAGVARLVIGMTLLAGPARLSAVLFRLRKEMSGTLEDAADDDTPKPEST